MLLSLDGSHDEFINDDTVEAATLLISKVGYLIDDKLIKIENTPDSERKPAILQKGKDYQSIYDKFYDLAKDNDLVSKRL
jgi:hypothetical protein